MAHVFGSVDNRLKRGKCGWKETIYRAQELVSTKDVDLDQRGSGEVGSGLIYWINAEGENSGIRDVRSRISFGLSL